MKPTQTEFEALQRLAKQFDDATSYIDSNSQRNEAIRHNESILKILAYYGLDLNFNAIPAKRMFKYNLNGLISEDEEFIRGRMFETYEKAFFDKEMIEKEPKRRQIILENNVEYKKIETVPVLVDFKYYSAFQLQNVTEIIVVDYSYLK